MARDARHAAAPAASTVNARTKECGRRSCAHASAPDDEHRGDRLGRSDGENGTCNQGGADQNERVHVRAVARRVPASKQAIFGHVLGRSSGRAAIFSGLDRGESTGGACVAG